MSIPLILCVCEPSFVCMWKRERDRARKSERLTTSAPYCSNLLDLPQRRAAVFIKPNSVIPGRQKKGLWFFIRFLMNRFKTAIWFMCVSTRVWELSLPRNVFVVLFFFWCAREFLEESHVIILTLCPGRKSSTCHFQNLQYLSVTDSVSFFFWSCYSQCIITAVCVPILCTVIKSSFFCSFWHTYITLSLFPAPNILSSLPAFTSLMVFSALFLG